MQLIIIRHGDAPYTVTESGERDRLLSEKGEIDVYQVTKKWLQGIDGNINKNILLLSSPLERAQQTADIVHALLQKNGFDVSRENEHCLIPEASTEITASYLESLENETIMIVSHMPLVANLLSYWLPEQRAHFPTSAIAHLEIVASQTKLVSFFKPD